MIPKAILKKIRQIELRTNRLVTETLGGQYHSVFKGQGMNFEEVREYQHGDDVRFIDWNVTARMNHPFIKKYVEERELTLMLVVDLSASGLFGSADQSKRELAAEIAAVLAFSAIRNNDKVGLILYTDEVERYFAPRKGRRHVLRVIRDILFHEPKRTGTQLNTALQFLNRVTPHRAIVAVISDFLGEHVGGAPAGRSASPSSGGSASMGADVINALRQTHRRHDVVAVQVSDRYELELPPLGLLTFEDAETGEIREVPTGDAGFRKQFQRARDESQRGLEKLLRSARIDSLHLYTHEPYGSALAKFFETRQKRMHHG